MSRTTIRLLRPSGESDRASSSDYKNLRQAGASFGSGRSSNGSAPEIHHCPEGENRSESEEITPAAAATARRWFIVMCGQVNMCFQSTIGVSCTSMLCWKRYALEIHVYPRVEFLDIAISAPVLHKHRLMCRIRHEQMAYLSQLIPDSYFCLAACVKRAYSSQRRQCRVNKIKVGEPCWRPNYSSCAGFLLGMNTTRTHKENIVL
jgi:hypothetical protein